MKGREIVGEREGMIEKVYEKSAQPKRPRHPKALKLRCTSYMLGSYIPAYCVYIG